MTWETGEPTSLPDRRLSPMQLMARKSCVWLAWCIRNIKSEMWTGRGEGPARSFETSCGYGKEVSVLQCRALETVMFMIMVT